MLKVTASNLRYFRYIYISYANGYPPLLINFLNFFHPGHSYPNPLPINYWGKFPTETNFLKQYPCAEFFAISQKEWPICSGFCFVSSRKVSTLGFALQDSIKKPTYCQLLTSFHRNQMFVDVFIECVAWSYW